MILRSFLLIVLLLSHSVAFAGPIYVFKEPDGTIRFTNKPPPSGAKVQVFTGKGSLSLVSLPGHSRQSFLYRHHGGKHGKKLFTQEYDQIIRRAARYHGVDQYLVRAVIHAESAFNPRAVSSKGAKGLMQLMPGTAQDLGVVNPFSPSDNVWGGTKYLKELMERFKGNTVLAVAAYNAGFANVDQYGGIPPFSETRLYVKKVMALQTRYRAVSLSQG